MTILWVILGICAVIYALTYIRVGVLLSFSDGDLYFAITIAGRPLTLDQFFGNDKPERKRKPTRKPKRAKKPEKKFEMPPFDKLYAIVINILGKLRRKITINALFVTLTIGGEASTAAITCGVLTELVGSLLPVAEDFVKIKNSRIVISPTFTAEQSDLKVRGKVTTTIGALIGIAVSGLIQFVILRKEMKNDGKASTGGNDGNDDEADPRDGRRKYHRGISHTDA